MKQAVVLFSGGLDSTTVLATAQADGYTCHALSFTYGQRSESEVEFAKAAAKTFNAASHKVVNLDLSIFAGFGGSALTDSSIAVPDYQGDGEIPITYVPNRNTIFLSIALAYAEILGAKKVYIGASSVDYSGYPDCRPEYFDAFNQLAALSNKTGVEGNPIHIEAPLMYLSKAQTIELGLQLGVDYANTVSCYQADADGKACGRCDSCHLRKQAFQELGIADPTRYQEP